MSMIESYLKSVNERCPNRGAKYVGCNTVLHYLDKKFPKWRIEIKNREEWKVAFEFDICIRPDDNMLAFADELFDIIGNTEAEMFVWSNKECNEFYRYVAIQRLRKIDEAGYLPQYIDELKKGNFQLGYFGWLMVGEIFDFPTAVDVALEMCAAGLDVVGLAFSYLTKVTPLYWDRYPENIKDKIIDQGSSILYKNISRELWSKLSLMHKFKLVHKVVTEELKVFHDLNAICQCYDNSDTTRTIFLADGSESDLKDIRKEKDTTLKSLMLGFCIAPEVYKPGIDIDTNQYTPSKRISKFIEVSEGDTMFNNMLWQVVSDIEYAASGSNRFDFEFPSFE